jgi:hypothetical protein
MEYILVVAAIYNLVGAFVMWFQHEQVADSSNTLSAEYMQYRIFTGGTAFLFSIIYIYVFFVPAIAVPLLVFGIALKLWSFTSSLICYKKFNFPKADFLKVGVGNLIFAVLFIFYLVANS